MKGQTAAPQTLGVTQKRSVFKRALQQWDLQILVIPAIIYILIFMYIPMYGMIMAFQEYRLGEFPGFSEWVGLKQFNYLFTDPNFMRVLRNTLVISGLRLLICFPMPIIFAIMLNEIRSLKFKKVTQTISYLPHFISWVVAARLMMDFFSPDNGAVNTALVSLGILDKPLYFFGESKYFWGMVTGTNIWKELGWDAIIYVAAITSIDAEQYEAASIDGAGRLAKMWHITLATIRPTIIILLIFTVGGMLNANFDQIMMLTNQMRNALLRDTADVIDTYVYRVGIREARFSYASAAGLFRTIINFGLLLGTNFLADRLGNSALF